MRIRVLTNADDTLAVFYNDQSDWAFGPVVYTHGTNLSAEVKALTFIKWAGLRKLEPAITDEALAKRWAEFESMLWHKCKTCEDWLAHCHQVECDDCMATCDDCGKKNTETRVQSYPNGPRHSRSARRVCEPCSSEGDWS